MNICHVGPYRLAFTAQAVPECSLKGPEALGPRRALIREFYEVQEFDESRSLMNPLILFSGIQEFDDHPERG